jgi:hypothetical protein
LFGAILSDFRERPPILRLFVYAATLVATIAIVVHFFRHGNPVAPAAPSTTDNVAAASPTSEESPAAAGPRTGESQILAACQPHLGPNTLSVPNIDVGEMPNPAAVRLKVRFWVNGEGFVTQAFVAGANVYTAGDQETALDYIKVLTFLVPNTPECRARKMEVIGNFLESRSSNGEWETVLDLYPRYSFDGTRVVQSR